MNPPIFRFDPIQSNVNDAENSVKDAIQDISRLKCVSRAYMRRITVWPADYTANTPIEISVTRYMGTTTIKAIDVNRVNANRNAQYALSAIFRNRKK